MYNIFFRATYLSLYLGFTCVYLLPEISAEKNTLKFVQAIWRHGDRAPKYKPYPADKYDESFWPRGWSQLTNKGMQEMKELGAYFREHYTKEFISPVFKRDEVYLKSSNADRALVSAQAFLNGLFPPTEDQEFFEPGLNWQPIPVHASASEESDPLLKPTSFRCPAYKRLKTKAAEGVEAELSSKYIEFFEYLKPIVQAKGPKVRLREVTKLIDIEREILHNLSQPDWVFKNWPQYSNKTTLDIVLELRHIERTAEFNETSLFFLTSGLLLGDWLDRIEAISRGELVKPKKMMLYSSHDGTIQGLLYALQTAEGYKIPYASCLIMELHEKQGYFFVELYYRTPTTTNTLGYNMEQLVIKGCVKSCPLDKFMLLLRANALFKTENLYQLLFLAL
uniref:Acid phosphatase n=1 Tax=Ditylenchus dipsaci TaxID=166011 RepID=A0A915CKY2_9BILA